MDWKDALASLSGLPAGSSDSPDEISDDNAVQKAQSKGSGQKSPLHVLIEKKGRGGKTATIIEGFEIADDEINEIAHTLKKKLGTGGSARGGEILIQGDRKPDIIRILKELGFKTKG